MHSLGNALRRLGLSASFDERSVRRAYARELKRIDQDNDPEGFQILREAYELVLEWIREEDGAGKKGSQGTEGSVLMMAHESELLMSQTLNVAGSGNLTDPNSVEAPSDKDLSSQDITGNVRYGAGDQNVSPEVMAKMAFDALLNAQTLAPLSAEHTEKLLAQTLDDHALVSIDGRAYFEWLVAARLADGWQPGNEALFSAALSFFDWRNDRQRLLRFGLPGHKINSAIEELILFNQHEPAERQKHMKLIRSLRIKPEDNGKKERLRIPLLAYLLTHYPTLMETIACRENYEKYFPGGVPVEPAPYPNRVKTFFSFVLRWSWSVVCILYALIRFLAAYRSS